VIRPRSKEAGLRIGIAVTGDIAISCGALIAAVLLRRNVPLQFTKSLLPPANLPLDLLSFFMIAATLVSALALSGFYRQRLTPRGRPRLAVAILMHVVLLTTAATFVARPVPRTILIVLAAIEAILIPLWRLLLQSVLTIRPRQTILYGSPAEVAGALSVLDLTADPRMRVVGWAGEECAELSVPYLGSITNLTTRARLRDVEEVICAGSSPARLDLLRVRGPRGFLLLASHADALLASSTLGWIGDQPLVQVAVGCGIGFQAMMKRTLDLVVSTVLVVASAPLWLLAALAIWIEDRNPVVIRQQRVGLGGIPFAMWKLRSMRDGEVTHVGSLLRRYHIDELAQLLNVITGDMSLVGPRPERPDIADDIQRELPDFDLRCLVRPGIAGLAQVSAEYDSRPEVKLRYDLMYMCDWSLLLDVRLLLHSVSTSLSGSGV
jgi:lipopolysaccharide/colanic/teichoic acid biosynthesis glycosyltransferase